MDYQEKLRLAKEALDSGSYDKKTIEYIFPELRESSDEKIRKTQLDYWRSVGGKEWHGVPVQETIAWLEKQGEQKEINLVEILKHYPKETELYSPLYGKLWLAEIDEECGIITCYKYPLDKDCTRAILEQEDTVSFYSNGTTGLPDFSISKDCMLFLYDIEKQGEQKPTPKFKIGDTIHKIGENTVFPRTIEKIEDGYYVCNNSHSFVNIKFQDDYELVEQKPAWSKEDNKMLNSVIQRIKQLDHYWNKPTDEKMIDWLKSLKPHWKPSEEQMQALETAMISSTMPWQKLLTLYNDFKNL